MTEEDAIKLAHEIVGEMGGVPAGTNLTPIVRALCRVAREAREDCAVLASLFRCQVGDEIADEIRKRSNEQGERPPR